MYHQQLRLCSCVSRLCCDWLWLDEEPHAECIRVPIRRQWLWGARQLLSDHAVPPRTSVMQSCAHLSAPAASELVPAAVIVDIGARVHQSTPALHGCVMMLAGVHMSPSGQP